MEKDQDGIDIQLIGRDISYIKQDVADIKKKMEADYVTKDQLKLTTEKVALHQKIIFGVISVIGTQLVIAIVGAAAYFLANKR